MYDNIGGKIKVLAVVVGILLLLGGIIAWLILITNTYESWRDTYYQKADDWLGWVSLVSGIFGYISSWFMYGFGQLIEDTEVIRIKMNYEAPSQSIIRNTNNSGYGAANTSANTQAQKQGASLDATYCINCGAKRDGNSSFCTSCGQRF